MNEHIATPELWLRNVRLSDRAELMAVGLRGERIHTIIPEQQAATSVQAEGIDGAGQLLIPAFVDAHFHLDSVLTRLPNASGTLREGIDNWSAYKRDTLSTEDIIERASRYCEHALRQGIMAIRSHVDVSDPQLRTAEGLLAVRERFADRLDIQLVAFPQDGLYADAEAEQRLLRALDMGVEVVGGIPHNEPTYAEGSRSIDTLLRIAAERGLAVDMHCDESDDPHSRHVETLAAATVRFGLQGRVTASHITASATYDPYYLSRRLLPLMARAELNVTVNPLINVHLGGRFSHPAHRAMAPVRALLEAGLNVSTAQDCNEDPWYPLGNADMFEVARMAGHLGHLLGDDDLPTLLHMITTAPARTLGLDWVLAPGRPANLLLLRCSTLRDALRTSAPCALRIRNGQLLDSMPAAETGD
jgi:cytosine deaminase